MIWLSAKGYKKNIVISYHLVKLCAESVKVTMNNHIYNASHKKLVKTQVMNLNSYNRTTGTTQNWSIDFATGLIQSSAGFYDSIKIEPLQCVISRS